MLRVLVTGDHLSTPPSFEIEDVQIHFWQVFESCSALFRGAFTFTSRSCDNRVAAFPKGCMMLWRKTLRRTYLLQVETPTAITATAIRRRIWPFWPPGHETPSCTVPGQLRCFSSSNSSLADPVSPFGSTTQSLTDPLLLEKHDLLSKPGGVRQYFREWSANHQKQLKENAPNQILVSRTVSLPTSLFVRERSESGTQEQEDDIFEGYEFSDADEIVTSQQHLRPGDVTVVQTSHVKRQFALFLGQKGVQGQYVLADGRWYVTTKTLWGSHIVHDFATDQQITAIKQFLPAKAVELSDTGVSMEVLGDVPQDVSLPVLQKMAKLTDEAEDAKRKYADAVDRIFKALASETECRRLLLQDLIRDGLGVPWDSLNDGTKVVLLNKLNDDDRFFVVKNRAFFRVALQSKQINRAILRVQEWARQYQDAAAQAAGGRDVAKALQENPLTNFITKARRLIAKSRKIRTPTVEGYLGPTLKSALPASGGVERRATGEVFDDDDKTVITFLWAAYVLKPFAQAPSNKHNQACGSLILRAVGAYPKYELGTDTAALLLQEIGSLDPWFCASEHHAQAPLHFLGLNETARVLKEKEQSALAKLENAPEATESLLRDTMADLRKDWGELEVFCIDSDHTQVVDDGISIENSQEHPGATWVHIHIAHPSAFIPFDSPFMERAEFMGGSHYDWRGSEPCFPFRFTELLSIRSGGPVMTTSTLIGADGSVLDVRMCPGIVRNVQRFDPEEMRRALGTHLPVHNQLVVGHTPEKAGAPHQRTTDAVTKHLPWFHRLIDVLTKRHEARLRERPNYLDMKVGTKRTVGDVKVRFSKDLDRGWQRIFRSEHCYGDPYLSLTEPKMSLDDTTMKPHGWSGYCDPVAGCMLLVGESAGAWARQRNVPVIYRYQECNPAFPIDKLNSLGPHEGYLSLVNGESMIPKPYLIMNAEQYITVSSPLRRYRDIQNYYQIDAYLKAEAAAAELGSPLVEKHIKYPWSKAQLLHDLKQEPNYQELRSVDAVYGMHWRMMALFRAFHFKEADLPKTWDVFIDNPVTLARTSSSKNERRRGTLMGLHVPVQIAPSEAGWEKDAKFRQYLPCKLEVVDYRNRIIEVVAVGPAADTPQVEDFAYPELRPLADKNDLTVPVQS